PALLVNIREQELVRARSSDRPAIAGRVTRHLNVEPKLGAADGGQRIRATYVEREADHLRGLSRGIIAQRIAATLLREVEANSSAPVYTVCGHAIRAELHLRTGSGDAHLIHSRH